MLQYRAQHFPMPVHRATAALAAVCLLAPVAAGQHEIWEAGDPNTNQAIHDMDGNPNNGVQQAHSSLVARPGAPLQQWVRDTDLGGANMALLAKNNGADMMWAFAQCFGGGFFDELNAVGGKQSMAAAARHLELANYPRVCALNGVRTDWADTYRFWLTVNVTADLISSRAARDDPWGVSILPVAGMMCPEPAPPLTPWPGPGFLGQRGAELLAAEHPQFHSTGNGDMMKIEDYPNPTTDFMAILWSGDPNWVDEQQIGALANTLLASQFPPTRIFILFRNGNVPPNGIIATAIAPLGPIPAVNLRPAEKCHLERVFSDHYGPAKPNPKLLFFFSNDHGGNTGVNGGRRAPRHSESPNSLPSLPSDEGGWIPGGPTPPVNCVLTPTGACCFGDDSCTLTTDADCATLGGVFHGNEVFCEDVFCGPPCLGDISVPPDGAVNVFDLFVLLSNWNGSGPGADLAPPLNVVDIFDLFVLLGNWGPCN